MKIVCSQCGTNYQIDDARIPEKGLMVKCSVCQNKFRVFKNEEGETAKNEPEEQKVDIASFHEQITDNATHSTLKSVPIDKKAENSEMNMSNDRFDSDEDLFADDPSDKPAKNQPEKPASDALFEEDPAQNDKDADFDDLFADAPSSSPKPQTGKNDADNLFGDDSEDELFGDFSVNKSQKKDDSDDFLKELFEENPIPKSSAQTIFFRNRKTGKVIGPVEESQVDQLMINGEISEDDDISYDGVNWNSDSGENVDFEDVKMDDNFGTVLFEEGTMIHKDEGEEINIDDSMEGNSVDHVYIPEEFSENGAKPKKKVKKGRGRANAVLFYAGTIVATVAILAIIGGGAYYFYTKRNNSADILDNISEQIAVNTGTLADVREALDKDTPEDYMNSIGILKQYIKPDDSAPSAVGLDGQVKMNLLISYNKRIESSASIDEKITTAMKKAAGNADLVKAKALYLYEQKQYDEAAALLQPFTDKNDQEVFYILGLIASGKHDLEKAESFFNTGFIQGGGKSVKIMFALANMKFQNGDTQSAMAFINRIIAETPNYMKAYLLKSKILMNGDKLAEADKFLKGIDTNIVAKAEDFQKAEYYQALATVANRRGLMKEAIKYYEKAVEINQTDTDAITKIADFYVQISDSTKAMEYYDMALKIDAKYSAAIIGKTEIYVLLSQKEKIYLELAKLDLKNLTNPQLLARVARIYSNIGDKAKALDFYDMAIKSDPSYVEPYLAKAQILLMDFNKVKDLEQILVVLEKLGKDRYPYHLVKAIIDHKNADYKSAEEHFRVADEKNSAGDERVYFFYGEFLKDQQKYAEASDMLHRAYKADPENYDYMQSYIDSLEKEKKWKTVISMLESKTFLEKRKYKSYASLANAYLHTKEYEKALAAINHALELSTQNTYVYYLKAKILYTMERYAEAEKEIDTAVVLDMKNFENYMLYARVLSKRGDYKGAVEKIEAAEKIDPQDQDLLLMKGVIYKNLDDYRNALKYFNRVTNKSLKKEAYLEIGESYMQLGKRKEAMEYLKKAEKSGNHAAERQIAIMLYDDGQIDKAITYFKKVLRHDKNDVEAMRQLGYIYKEREELAKALSYFKLYLKKVSDYNERKMIEDEVFYIQQNLPKNAAATSEKHHETPAEREAEIVEEEEEKEVQNDNAVNEEKKEEPKAEEKAPKEESGAKE